MFRFDSSPRRGRCSTIPPQIFESAEKKTEVGAALGVPLNAQLVLEYLGYSKDNLKSVNFDGVSEIIDRYPSDTLSDRGVRCLDWGGENKFMVAPRTQDQTRVFFVWS